MEHSIHRYFQVGTIQWMSYPPQEYSVTEAIRRIACDAYFDAIEVTRISDPEQKRKAQEILEQSHLTVCYGAQPDLLAGGLNPNATDEAARSEAERVLLDSVDEAQSMGAKGIAFLAGKWEPATREEALAQLVKTTCNVCRYAAQKGMRVELEVFDYDMDKAALIGPAPLALRFAQEVRSRCDNFGLLVDLSHFPTTYETSRFVIQTLRPYITHLHIGNAVVKQGHEAYGDQHPRFGFANSANDTAELLDFFRVLKQEGFFRAEEPMVLSCEVKPWKNEDAEIVLANTKRVIERAWSLLEA